MRAEINVKVSSFNPVQKQVVMLANGHVPYDTRIFIKEAQSLTEEGFKVSIILPYEKTEHRNGIDILGIAPAKSGLGKLIVNPFRILRKAISQPSASIFCIHDSDILLTGWALKLLGRKVIYDAHEDTPLQIQYQHWIPKILRVPYAWLYRFIEKISGWLFNAIIVAEPVIKKYFPSKKTFLVRNFSSIESFKKLSSLYPYADRPSKLVYVGLLSEARGLFEMLEGAKIAQSKINFEFLLGGKFSPPSLQEKVIKNYKVSFNGWVEFNDLPEVLYKSKIGIIVPNPNPRYKTNYPVKLFEYMAAALPVIASREGESALFVEEARCGILVDPKNTSEIAEAIQWLFQNPVEAEAMGKRGQALIFEKYNWENERAVLVRTFQHV